MDVCEQGKRNSLGSGTIGMKLKAKNVYINRDDGCAGRYGSRREILFYVLRFVQY